MNRSVQYVSSGTNPSLADHATRLVRPKTIFPGPTYCKPKSSAAPASSNLQNASSTIVRTNSPIDAEATIFSAICSVICLRLSVFSAGLLPVARTIPPQHLSAGLPACSHQPTRTAFDRPPLLAARMRPTSRPVRLGFVVRLALNKSPDRTGKDATRNRGNICHGRRGAFAQNSRCPYRLPVPFLRELVHCDVVPIATIILVNSFEHFMRRRHAAKRIAVLI